MSLFIPGLWQQRTRGQDHWSWPVLWPVIQKCHRPAVWGKKKKAEKSIGFHYVVGQCHWPVNDPVTGAVQGWRWAHTQSLLTRGKHADSHREQVGTQICTSSSRPRRYRARPPRGEGQAQLGQGVCMCVSLGWGVGVGILCLILSDCLALQHKCFYPAINYSPLNTPKETGSHWLWLRGNSQNPLPGMACLLLMPRYGLATMVNVCTYNSCFHAGNSVSHNSA